MKKKVFVGIGIVVIIIAAAMIMVFLMSTKDTNVNKNVLSISDDYFKGTWCVAQRSGVAVKNEYFVFDENYVSDYRDNSEEAYMSSVYSIIDSGMLSMSDVSKKFVIEAVSNNIVKLIDTESKEVWNLLRCSGDGLDLYEVSDFEIEGTWNVLFHGGQAVQGETMIFDNGAFVDYRDGSTEPYLESTYEWNENGYLLISKLDLEIEVFKTGDSSLGLIETDTGYIWEIEKE